MNARMITGDADPGWPSQGRDDADWLLRSVYDTFTKGLATADLTEARELLESVPSQSTG